jgi:hypothetical protein
VLLLLLLLLLLVGVVVLVAAGCVGDVCRVVGAARGHDYSTHAVLLLLLLWVSWV